MADDEGRDIQDLGNGFLVLWYEYEEGQWVQQYVSEGQWQRADSAAKEVFWTQLRELVESKSRGSSAGIPPPGGPLWPWPFVRGSRTG